MIRDRGEKETKWRSEHHLGYLRCLKQAGVQGEAVAVVVTKWL